MATQLRLPKRYEGTAYGAALQREHGNIRNCDDAAAMAGFLEGNAQILLGAVSPKLMWEGAQHCGLTTKQLNALIIKFPAVAMDLMWVETDRPVPAKLAAQVADYVAQATGGLK